MKRNGKAFFLFSQHLATRKAPSYWITSWINLPYSLEMDYLRALLDLIKNNFWHDEIFENIGSSFLNLNSSETQNLKCCITIFFFFFCDHNVIHESWIGKISLNWSHWTWIKTWLVNDLGIHLLMETQNCMS